MLSERLKYLRREKKLSQAALAEAIGVGQSSIASYERDERKPSYEVLCLLADYFEVSTDYLLGRTDVPHMYSHEAADVQGGSWQIFSNAKDLPPEGREQVERQIQGAVEDDQQVILQCSSQDDLEKLVRQIVAQTLEERDKQNDDGQ